MIIFYRCCTYCVPMFDFQTWPEWPYLPSTEHAVHLSKMLNISFQRGSAATLHEWCFISLAITNTELINVLVASLNWFWSLKWVHEWNTNSICFPHESTTATTATDRDQKLLYKHVIGKSPSPRLLVPHHLSKEVILLSKLPREKYLYLVEY